MRLSTPVHSTLLLFASLLLCVPAQVVMARERGPRVQVVCPQPPISVQVAGQQVLVYELHVTNFDLVPLEVKQIDIFSGADRNHGIKTISAGALPGLILEIGTKPGSKDSQIIAPGQTAVVFLWLELGDGQQAPVALHHRIVFATTAPTDSTTLVTEATLQDFVVDVSHDSVPSLRSPFDGGVWFAGDLSNSSTHRRSLAAIDGAVHAPERFAIDFVKVGPNGDTKHDEPSKNENWWGYGEPIHAVADGTVTQVVDGIPDNVPRVPPRSVTLDNIAGNYVIIRIAPNRFATYAHLKSGSITVQTGDKVRSGQVLGQLGNSGNTTGPHLHFQVTDGNSVLQSEGVPFVFDRYVDLGPGSSYETNKHPSVPRTQSLPANDVVIESLSMKK